ncbi:MAG: SurA N-terminal domain-containing protein [Treponema sp.]|nr:SurA N-terminal domain-containing protein [Treponema sp.]
MFARAHLLRAHNLKRGMKMKRLALVAAIVSTMFFSFASGAFAQADLQPLAVVKLNKSESITLKQLRTRVELYQKQNNNQAFSVEQKKQILESMIDEKLIIQSAQKSGLSLTETQVNKVFLQQLSMQVGRQVSEAEFAEIIKSQTNLSLDDFMKKTVGMSVAEYKTHLKNQIIIRQYVESMYKDEIGGATATDAEIRNFYDLNKASFVQNDMAKIFLVVVPKGNDVEAARSKANKMLNDLKDKKLSYESIKANATADKTYQGGDLLIQKSVQHAQQLGMSVADLNELFGKSVGFISNLTETKNDFQFYAVRQKYPAKMLSISDVVQPDTTITVYEYIKQNLSSQKQGEAFLAALNKFAKSLDTPENVDRKKTGDALDKLLNW